MLQSGCGYQHLSRVGAIWTLPNTVLGLTFALLSGAIPRPQDGLLVAESDRGVARWFLSRRGIVAFTLGRVVVSTVSLDALLLRHEHHHAREYDVLGSFFLPLYLTQHARRGD